MAVQVHQQVVTAVHQVARQEAEVEVDIFLLILPVVQVQEAK